MRMKKGSNSKLLHSEHSKIFLLYGSKLPHSELPHSELLHSSYNATMICC